MNRHEIVLHLSFIEGLGPIKVQKVISLLHDLSDWNAIYKMSVHEFRRLGFTEHLAAIVHKGLQDRTQFELEQKIVEMHSVEWISILHDRYPHYLKQINGAPPILYFRGSLTVSEQIISIVGSRMADKYAENFIAHVVPELVRHDFTVVSGGALGADAMAHEYTVQAGGKTVVVLGSGILRPHPRSHKKLFDRIVEGGGAIISSFPLMTDPHASHFPVRNRIISGLSRGVIVVQAAEKSGTRITAHYALDQGRDVFALPGPIDSELSAGCHRLIQEGAKLVTCAQDVLEEYGLQAQKKKSVKSKDQKSDFKNDLSDLQRGLVSLCAQAQSIDDLAKLNKMKIAEVQKELFTLQMKGIVAQDFTGRWKVA